MKTKILLLLLASLALLLSACDSLGGAEATPESSIPIVETSGAILSEGNLVPRDFAYLAFPTGGHVSELLVSVGDSVAEGQVLARLGDREQAEANLAAAQLELERTQQELDSLNENADITGLNAWLDLLNANEQAIRALAAWNEIDTDAYQERVDNADLKVSEAETELEDARADFDTYAELDENNPTRQRYETALIDAQLAYDEAVAERDQLIIDRDRAQANLELARAVLAQAQADYDATRSGPDPEMLALAEMRLANAEAQVSAAQSALDLRDLKAPFAGTVVELNLGINELVGSDTWAVLLADFSEWYVETNDLTELDVVQISLGQGAGLTPDALSEQTFRGEVIEIANMFSVQSGDILYQVRLRVSEPDPAFRWGMTVEVKFSEVAP
jgi:multidrug efflux pump subunit AcrA (membrane-fusion protein)